MLSVLKETLSLIEYASAVEPSNSEYKTELSFQYYINGMRTHSSRAYSTDSHVTGKHDKANKVLRDAMQLDDTNADALNGAFDVRCKVWAPQSHTAQHPSSIRY